TTGKIFVMSNEVDEGLYTRPTSNLDNTIIERIAQEKNIIRCISQHLGKQHDRFNFCLVLKAWSPTAVNSLWSEPIFNTPESFHSFDAVVRRSALCALRVRVLDLCNPENAVVNSFEPVLKSLRQEHQRMRTCVLSKRDVIMRLVRLCENLSSIKVYGWNLTDSDIQAFPQHCTGLKEFCVIGNTGLTRTAISSIVNSECDLRVLDLDGTFNLPDSFAEALANKKELLNSLKLCTKSMTTRGFHNLAKKLTRLNKLILQDCPGLTNRDIAQFVNTNYNLKTISLSGEQITIESLKVICNLKELRHLDLRCKSHNCELTPDDEFFGSLSKNLHTILLENLAVNDDIIDIISTHCEQLEVFGLSRCLHVTERSIERVSRNSKNLRVVNVVKCPNITEKCLKFLARYSRKTLTQFIVESCGSFSPEGVHWLARNIDKLEKIAFHDTPSILETFVCKFSSEQLSSNQHLSGLPSCTIEGENLKKLIRHKTPQNDLDLNEGDVIIPKTKLSELAAELNLSFDTLDRAIKKVIGKECSTSSAENIHGNFGRRDSLNSAYSGSPRRESKDFDSSETRTSVSRHNSYPTVVKPSPIKKTQSGWTEISIKIPCSHRKFSSDAEQESSFCPSTTNNVNKPDHAQTEITKISGNENNYLPNEIKIPERNIAEHEPRVVVESPLSMIDNHQLKSPTQETCQDKTILRSQISNSALTSQDSEKNVLEANVKQDTLVESSSSPKLGYNEISKQSVNDVKQKFQSLSLEERSTDSNIDETGDDIPFSWNNDILGDTSGDLGGWEEMGFTDESNQMTSGDGNHNWAGDDDWSRTKVTKITEKTDTPTKKDTPRKMNYTSIDARNSQSRQEDNGKWPTPSEAATFSSKNVETGEHNEHNVRNVNFASPWGTPKDWSSVAGKKQREQPNPVSGSNQLKTTQTSAKRQGNDNGWGTPSRDIPWDDPRQGYCWELIKEQKETVYWSNQNGRWVNVSEETKISEKKTFEVNETCSNVRKVERTQRTEQRQEFSSSNDDFNKIREQSRRGRGFETNNDITIELVDSANEDEFTKKEEIITNYDGSRSSTDGARERLGNPRWKTESEWNHEGNRQNSLPKPGRESGDLMNFDIPDISDSKSSSDDSEEILSIASNKGDGVYPTVKSSNLQREDISIDLSDSSNSDLTQNNRLDESVALSNSIGHEFNKKNNGQDLLIDLGQYNEYPTQRNSRLSSKDSYLESLSDIFPNTTTSVKKVGDIEQNLLCFDDENHFSAVENGSSIRPDEVESFNIMENITTRADESKSDASAYVNQSHSLPASMNSYPESFDVKENVNSSWNNGKDEPSRSEARSSVDIDVTPSGERSNKINFLLETPTGEKKKVSVSPDSDIDAIARQFCQNNDIMHSFESVRGIMEKKLQKMKKKKSNNEADVFTTSVHIATNSGIQKLSITSDSNIDSTVEDFCQKWNALDQFHNIKKLIVDKFEIKRQKRLVKARKAANQN
ncbi:5729_t:CDS:2, partial [Acaulospora morrowiae]